MAVRLRVACFGFRWFYPLTPPIYSFGRLSGPWLVDELFGVERLKSMVVSGQSLDLEMRNAQAEDQIRRQEAL